ncbi:hypothetical protein GCM10007972_05610 [Iodidimonas muriae]|uniref:Uncharacterized protein n=1 Tax=Iodidimonas muriae TaxID=261467 RepID=A0ABQ2L8S3_9PROT|nr:hypothetical protein JCM17843_00980 [Kordiimonadales bacterium JCM 17843]GGO06895.1 hypothetical protein GCM10007972_05610 [Iodidimonas muriae]
MPGACRPAFSHGKKKPAGERIKNTSIFCKYIKCSYTSTGTKKYRATTFEAAEKGKTATQAARLGNPRPPRQNT